jgi:hypothetical protein
MLNLQRLFYSSSDDISYHGAILPTEEQKQHLTQAKNKIRDHLREGIERASTTVLGQAQKVSPRFRTQGSWSYNTCNQRAYMPPQEMDWDLGVYLPISVWEGNRPKIAAAVYYQLLEALLKSLCAKEEWTLCPKDTCVRVQIGKSCHVDVPPYAAPDKQFAAIQERMLAKASASTKDARYAEAIAFGEMPEADWDSLKEIVLATRSGEWKPSDPGVVSDWFRHQIEEHGEQLRRVSRYLKGWRDYQWREGGPSSVCLMICGGQSFQPMHGRDDLALLEVTRDLGDKLAGNLYEDLIDEREDFNNLSPEERIAAAAKAQSLYRALKDGLGAYRWQKMDVLKALRAQFGPRIPNEVDWIADDTPQAVVRAAPAVVVPQPEVRRTRSG